MDKLYFETRDERDAFNAAEAEFRGCDLRFTSEWFSHGEDIDGYFIELTEDVDGIEDLSDKHSSSLITRITNWFKEKLK